MPDISKAERVKLQYSNSKNLSIRQKLHDKHSINKYGWHNWVFDQYHFAQKCRILELGCATGAFWENRIDKLPNESFLLLSDFSFNLVKEAWDKFSNKHNVLVQKIDIQDIPFPDSSFDYIIANHMLYHVPDLEKALAEVHRTLKSDGIFYCTTIGTEGMSKYLHNSLKDFDSSINAFDEGNSPFSLQNGKEILNSFFEDVNLINYVDSLRVTDTQDLIDWIESTISISGIAEESLEGLYDYFENKRLIHGFIEIPKQSGIFVSRK